MSTLHASLRDILLEDPSAIESLPRLVAARADRLLEVNGFEPLLYHRIRAHGSGAEIAHERFDRWRTAHLLALARSAAYGSAWRKLLDTAGAKGIPVRLLGGACMAFQVYPRPEMRPVQDLEVLAPAGRIEELRAALKSQRFFEVENLDPFAGLAPDAARPSPGTDRAALDSARGRSFRRPLERDGVILKLKSSSLTRPAPWDGFGAAASAASDSPRLPPAALAAYLAGRLGERRFTHSLLFLHDLMIVVRDLRPDWNEFANLVREAGIALEALLALHLLRDVFAIDVEAALIRELEQLLGPPPGSLALLKKVSLSAILQHPASARLVTFLGRALEEAREGTAGAASAGARASRTSR